VLEREEEAASVQQELLQLLARQARRVPYPVALSAILIAAMASHATGNGLPFIWLTAALGVLALRWWALGRLAVIRQVPIQQRMRWALGLSLLNGLVLSGSLSFSPYLSDFHRMVQTLMLLSLCAGAVATTAGHRGLLLSFMLPITVTNALSWVMFQDSPPGWVDDLVGLLILAFTWIMLTLGRDTWQVFVDSILIRQQQAENNVRLSLALQKAETAMQAKTRFLAAASHDLRQPMHTLSLFGAALLRLPLDAPAQRIARSMNVALESLSTQMDGLLDISRLDAQVVPVQSSLIRLSPWLSRLFEEFKGAALRKQLSLQLHCPPEACVESDPVLLERVLRNLLDNAIKYTQQGGVELRVEREDALWRLSVRDSGCGIALAEQSNIFEEFYQIDNPERDRAKGLGLGLSIVGRLVDLLDVHLELHSVPGQGSCFRLSLEAMEPADMPALASATTDTPWPTLRVLVIDNEAPVRDATQMLLASHGCEVMTATGTRDAVLKCLVSRPDIVLVDFRLHEGDDGITAVNSLRALMPGLPALLVSGDTAPERLREAHEAGLTLLHKPVLAEQLLSAIRLALNLH